MDTITLVRTLVGQPKVIGRDRKGDVWSSVDRRPVELPELELGPTGLEGDRVTDDRPKPDGTGLIHGGPDKAVYVYPCTHYAQWADELGEPIEPKSFGENWQVVGATEQNVHIGDVWEIGGARLQVSKPRQPCKTFALYQGRDRQMQRRMIDNGLCGWYLQVLRSGVVPTRGVIKVTVQCLGNPTVAEAFAAKMNKS